MDEITRCDAPSTIKDHHHYHHHHREAKKEDPRSVRFEDADSSLLLSPQKKHKMGRVLVLRLLRDCRSCRRLDTYSSSGTSTTRLLDVDSTGPSLSSTSCSSPPMSSGGSARARVGRWTRGVGGSCARNRERFGGGGGVGGGADGPPLSSGGSMGGSIMYVCMYAAAASVGCRAAYFASVVRLLSCRQSQAFVAGLSRTQESRSYLAWLLPSQGSHTCSCSGVAAYTRQE